MVPVLLGRSRTADGTRHRFRRPAGRAVARAALSAPGAHRDRPDSAARDRRRRVLRRHARDLRVPRELRANSVCGRPPPPLPRAPTCPPERRKRSHPRARYTDERSTNVSEDLAKPAREYATDEIVVEWRPSLCYHSQNCIAALPGVFDPERRPWIDVSAAGTDQIEAAVALCPSRAVSTRPPNTETRGGNHHATEGRAIPDGPLVLRSKLPRVGAPRKKLP